MGSKGKVLLLSSAPAPGMKGGRRLKILNKKNKIKMAAGTSLVFPSKMCLIFTSVFGVCTTLSPFPFFPSFPSVFLCLRLSL